ncbi:RT0821/Lpp0805 family surface protein [Pseudahrensia aquimaris]|uniref:RT0821/Lpp0805 family surface protein n=1 Tax=Pseudahrensia aquimaris TaxID=744461 RepID=A0ABW3FBW9_9HYPH
MRRNSAIIPLFFAASLGVLSSSGCAIKGTDDLAADLVPTDQIVTNSVARAAKIEGVEQSDADLIKATIAKASVGPDQTINWKNTETGSSGTVVSIKDFKGNHGQACREFKTTVDTFTGISYYNGETCKVSDDQWVLSWFKPAE